MPDPGSLEQQLRGAIFIVLGVVVILAPAVGCFVLSPFFVAGGIQPYTLAAALGVMLSEAIAISLLFALRRKRR